MSTLDVRTSRQNKQNVADIIRKYQGMNYKMFQKELDI